MSEPMDKIELLARAPIPKALLALGLPTMTGMLINALYNLADTYFVGRLGTDQMGAVSVAFPLGQVIVGFGLLFGNGAAAYISRLLGRGDRAKANQTASTALYSSLALGALLVIISLLCLKPLLQRLGALDSVMPYATAYTRIYLVFSIFNLFNVTMNNIAASEGAAQTAMGALLAGALLNVLADPVFIYLLDFGVAGAALATALAQMVSSLIYLRYIRRHKSLFDFSLKSCCFSREIILEILKIGVPTLIFQLLTSLSIAMLNNAAKVYGGSALAAMGPLSKIMSMGSLIVFGFLKGFQPLAGFSYGAKNFARLRQAIRTAIIWSSLFCAVFGLTAAFFARPIMSLFSPNDAQMINIGAAALRASGISFLFFGFYTVYSFLFLVMGQAGAGCFLGACRQGICFIPAILLLPRFCGLNGVLLAQPLADLLSALITLLLALYLHRQHFSNISG